MSNALRAGTAYFLAVFAIGFVLGAIRVTLVIPRIGALAAVCIEAPVMLALAWPVCDAAVRRFAVPPAVSARLAMGGFAFALLMIAELALAVLLFGRSPAQHWGSYRGLAEQVGLAGQVAFALFPLWIARRRA
jgi:hypothetical protein